MARFRIRNDARAWFNQIADFEHFKVDFDQYYLCLMAGFASGRSNENAPMTEMVDHFVEEYKPASRFLIGLLVIAELRKSGIDVTERTAVRALFKRLVDPHSPNQLTDEGMRRMNAYSSGGYDYLSEQRETKPYTGEEFLRDYVQLIDQAVGPIDSLPAGSQPF
ncbi:MAG: hypothetical protein E5Y10_33800 [Mesorhizobium sp.]|uniref:hypothetical protein n=1 Tax=Mesorhizobium sp. TaxID=1871066 RepID=UPI001202326C|nr:hypothetical protein [Mesorhizobium sp.]TIN32554.1 MAG: hypothetical protein E5Y13_33765 [Mesorhizobium sp.]TJU83753.1 MAG: hypothetical protein E5Y10_33800 [Mesorhizobium sp.]